MKRESPAPAVLIAAGTLLFLEVLCFAPHFLKTGFYLDDWVFLDRALGSGRTDLTAALRAFATPEWASRPLEIPLFALLTTLGGLEPWRYRAMNLGAELLLGLSLLGTLHGLSGRWILSLLAAALAMTFPNHGGTHLWMSQSPQTWAMAFCFAGFAAHVGGRAPAVPGGLSRARLALSQAGYLASLLLYESTFFMPVALAAGFWAAGPSFPRFGRDERGALTKAMLPYALSAAVFLAYQRLIAPMWLGPSPKQLVFSLRHAAEIYASAAACATVNIGRMLLGARPLVAAQPWWVMLPFASLAAGVLLGADDPGRDRRGHGGRVLAAVGASAFACAYLPYTFTQGYVPKLYGAMNRVNMGGGIAAGILLAALLDGFGTVRSGARLRQAAVAGLLAAFTVCHWMTGWQWAAAREMQEDIFQGLRKGLPTGSATVILRHTRPHLMGAPVFWSHYDLSRALWLRAGRRDITANWARNVAFDPEGLTIVNGDENTFQYPYRALFFYDGVSRRLVPVRGPWDPGGTSTPGANPG